jgi:putative inorganic carbon (HCO3(-)) transporter
MAGLALLGALGLAAGVLLLLAFRWPVLFAYGVLATMSLGYLGTLGIGTATFNNLLKAAAIVVVGLRLLLSGEGLRLPACLLHALPLLLLAGVGILYSPRFDAALMGWLRLLFVWAFALVLANLLRDDRHLRWMLHVMAVVLLVSAALACVQALQVFSSGPLAIRRADQAFRTGLRVGGTFYNPNKMAVHLMGMVVILFAAMPSLRVGWQRLAYLLSILVGLVAILLSLSRSGYLAIVLAGLLFLLSRRHRRQAAGILVLGVAALLVLLFFTPYQADLLGRLLSFTNLDQDGSSQIRNSLVLIGLDIFATGPHFIWGAGFDSFQVEMVGHLHPLTNHDGYYHTGIRASHNYWITVLAELGLLGVTALLFFLRGLYRELSCLHRNPGSPLRGDLVTGLLIYLSVKLVDLSLNPEFVENFLWYAVGLVGALAASAATAKQPRTAGPLASDYQK